MSAVKEKAQARRGAAKGGRRASVQADPDSFENLCARKRPWSYPVGFRLEVGENGTCSPVLFDDFARPPKDPEVEAFAMSELLKKVPVNEVPDLVARAHFRWESQPAFCVAAERFLAGLALILAGREWNRLSRTARRRAADVLEDAIYYLGWASWPGRKGTPWEKQPVLTSCYPNWPQHTDPGLSVPNEKTLAEILKLYRLLFKERTGLRWSGESEQRSSSAPRGGTQTASETGRMVQIAFLTKEDLKPGSALMNARKKLAKSEKRARAAQKARPSRSRGRSR
jgi:hypothetical protein